ncbi:MAG: DUF3253 domain-containing protein [Alphaproteobacteria bacterium]|nr:DUF3253 domain-containing protein [Alphaproteobacteria bacterium]
MTDNANENAPGLDPIAEKILELLAASEPNSSLSPQQIAQAVADARRRPNDPPDLWRRYLPAVKQQALHLARAGKLIVMRKGKEVDAQTAKGVIRYKRPI